MIRILLLATLSVLAAVSFACSSTPAAPGSSGDSPTEAYKRLFAAVKSKDTEKIKAELSKTTNSFAIAVAEKTKKPVEKVLENGFSATTFADSLPQIRDQRVDGTMGAVEVWNSKDSRWEDIPFIQEDGVWKLAVGDLFQGSYKSPGPSRSQREQLAANASGHAPQVQMPIANTNANVNIGNDGNPANRPPVVHEANTKTPANANHVPAPPK